MKVTIVHACLRDGVGGSPTAVLADGPFTDAERRAVPERAGTSHAVFTDGAGLRFFTPEGELPGCGHGTVAALAVLADETSSRQSFMLRAGRRDFAGWATRDGGQVVATFDPGPVHLRPASARELDLILPAFGPAVVAATCVASVGRPRLLITVDGPEALAALAPDLDALRAACRTLGLLGCYVHTPPAAHGRMAARMFAPAIGVPEDIANANSTACLAAYLADRRGGAAEIAVDMGDSLGQPATVTASAGREGVRVGGAARVIGTRALT